MKNDSFFIFSVFLGVLIPILFGIIYIQGNLSTNQNNNKEQLYGDKPKLLLLDGKNINKLNQKFIDEDNYFDNANCYIFQVSYINSEQLNTKYNLSITNINIDGLDDYGKLRWRLAYYDLNNDEYVVIDKGTFKRMTGNQIKINYTFDISTNQIHNYKLFYYLSTDDDLDGELQSNVTLTANLNIS